MTRPNLVKTMPEAAVSLACFSVLSYLLTSGYGGMTGLGAAFVLLAGGVAVAWSLGPEAGRRLWRVLTALGVGLGVFSLFRFAGLVQWPMGRPDSLRSYLFMLYSHVVLSATILATVLWGAYGKGIEETVSGRSALANGSAGSRGA